MSTAFAIEDEALAHLSPIGWEHVTRAVGDTGSPWQDSNFHHPPFVRSAATSPTARSIIHAVKNPMAGRAVRASWAAPLVRMTGSHAAPAWTKFTEANAASFAKAGAGSTSGARPVAAGAEQSRELVVWQPGLRCRGRVLGIWQSSQRCPGHQPRTSPSVFPCGPGAGRRHRFCRAGANPVRCGSSR